MTRFRDLARLQYERRLTPVEIAELDLLSATMTFGDREASGIPINPDTERQIERLRKRYEALNVDFLAPQRPLDPR